MFVGTTTREQADVWLVQSRSRQSESSATSKLLVIHMERYVSQQWLAYSTRTDVAYYMHNICINLEQLTSPIIQSLLLAQCLEAIAATYIYVIQQTVSLIG
jgi:hypothetical protein